jgi:hypothetical protein
MAPGLQLTRGQQIPVDTPFLSFLKREHGKRGDRLCSYLIPNLDRICVGVWVNRDAGRVTEILSYDRVTGPDRMDAERIRHYLSDKRIADNLRLGSMIRQAAAADREKQQAELESRRDKAAHRQRQQSIHNQGRLSIGI